MRIPHETVTTLAALMHTFDRSAAEVIHQLIAQATPEDFPQSWHLAVEEHRGTTGGDDGRSMRGEVAP